MGLHSARSRAFVVAGAIAIAASVGTASAKSTSSASAHSSAGFSAAIAANKGYETRPTSIGITTPVGAKIPKGKTIDFIQCGVPACVVEGNILAAATKLLDWKLVRINAGTSAQQIADAYQTAVTNKPNAVIGSGFDRSLFAPEIVKLKAMKIPVLEAFVADSTGNGIDVVGGPKLNAIQGKE